MKSKHKDSRKEFTLTFSLEDLRVGKKILIEAEITRLGGMDCTISVGGMALDGEIHDIKGIGYETIG